jgi:chloride channel protein, CIC family
LLEVILILEWKRRVVFWTGAVSVALVAIVFAVACDHANKGFHQLIAISPYLSLLITPAGLMLIAAVTQRFFAGSQGSGIPQTIASLDPQESSDVREKVLSMRVMLGKIGLTVIALFCGAAVGREGPTVQIGAAIMHKLGSFARFPRHDLERGLILAGGAAGVAAAFNTPLAGIVFAIEEMGRSFERQISSTIVMTVILAGLTSVAVLGNYTYFGRTSDTLTLGSEWWAVVVCGVAGGVLGGIFGRLLIAISRGLPGRAGKWIGEHPVQFAGVCGLVIAIAGIASGSTTYGSGYDEAKSLLDGKTLLPESFGLLKMVSVLASSVSGIPGGLLSPSLSAGAGLGANIAHVLTSAPAGATIILGMVAYFSGATQAPITAFVIVMEMTGNNTMLLPLMTASFIANSTSRLICPGSVYHMLAENFLSKRQPRPESR